MKAFCLNNISKVALATLKTPDVVVEDVNDADSILVRSADMHEYELPKNVLAVARAGAGVNNIPLEKYGEIAGEDFRLADAVLAHEHDVLAGGYHA